MDFDIVHKDEFQVVGIETLTSSLEGFRGIARHWERFYEENILEKSKATPEADIYGLYTDFEGDDHKEFKFIVGTIFKKADPKPEGFVIKTVPKSAYAFFRTRGLYPESLIEAWKEIDRLGLNRTYTGDFEVYNPKMGDPRSPIVDIYVSVKENV